MTVTIDIADGLAILTLARAQAHNALDAATKVAFLEAVTTAAADPSVRAVLLTAEVEISVSDRISPSTSPHSSPTRPPR